MIHHKQALFSFVLFPFVCTMEENHRLDYAVRTIGNTMIKIGQYPSVADLEFPNLKKYSKDIDKESMKELKRAIGLHAQGIGVGSYVYLRRIFERIVEKAKQQAEADQKIDLSEYNKMRVQERISLLKDYLPEMISSNPVIYGIVSKGIHELSEEECIKYFPVMKDCIIIILDQWEQKRREQENIKKLGTSLASISPVVPFTVKYLTVPTSTSPVVNVVFNNEADPTSISPVVTLISNLSKL